MSDDLFCPKHGPYPASVGSCPFCAREMGNLPPAPAPLGQEDTGAGSWGNQYYSDDEETVLPGSAGRRAGGEDETDLPQKGGRVRMDEDVTQLPERRRRILDFDEEDDDVEATVIEREDTSTMGWFIVKRSPYMRRGHMIKLRSGEIFGRNPRKADIMLDDEKVSGLHARIQIKEGQFVLIDLGSANGTWVNGEEIAGPKVLKQDDEIKLGDTVMVLKML